jgi:hypothetical protein
MNESGWPKNTNVAPTGNGQSMDAISGKHGPNHRYHLSPTSLTNESFGRGSTWCQPQGGKRKESSPGRCVCGGMECAIGYSTTRHSIVAHGSVVSSCSVPLFVTHYVNLFVLFLSPASE